MGAIVKDGLEGGIGAIPKGIQITGQLEVCTGFIMATQMIQALPCKILGSAWPGSRTAICWNTSSACAQL